jgi:hypothetical protein
MLLFKKKFLELIRRGEKTQTIRLWKWRRMRGGQRSYIPGAGYIRIDEVTEVLLEELTDEDARRDGFENADALREEIGRLYPNLAEGKHRPYRVLFTLLPPEEQERQKEEKRRRKQQQRQASNRPQRHDIDGKNQPP